MRTSSEIVFDLKERAKRYNKSWNDKNQHKRRAHRQVSVAVKVGLIKKSTTCENCGRSPRRLYGHHADYSKPLEVRWLCGKCHLAEHGMVIG